MALSLCLPALWCVAAAAEKIDGISISNWGEPNLNAAETQNSTIQHWLGWTWVAVFAAFVVYRVLVSAARHVRMLVCLDNASQTYFESPNPYHSLAQRRLVDAPLFGFRHRCEFRLGSLHMGCLPSRFQSLVLFGYIALNVVFCLIKVSWNTPEVMYGAEFRNRCGVLATMNTIPLFLFAGRNNPLVKLLAIDFGTYNLMHRWLGRLVVTQSLAHGGAYIYWEAHNFGWSAFAQSLTPDSMSVTGLVASGALAVMLVQSPAPIRHAFYETFLHLHFLLAGTFVGGLWLHLEGMAYLYLLYGAVAIWIFERTCRFLRLAYRNLGRRPTTAELEVLPGDAVRVTLKMPRPWKFQPGQYVFLYVPALGLWTSHPFSLAWSDEFDGTAVEQMPMHRQDVLAARQTSMSLLVRRRTGFTDSLYKRAERAKGKKAVVTAFVEGPYGSQSLASYGTVLLFACGVGITHQLPHLRALIAGHAHQSTATRRIVLVWIIQSPEHLDWIRGWMTAILGMEKRRDVLRVLLFVTRPRSTKEMHSPSASVQMFPGKPNVAALVDAEAAKADGALCVSVCGTGSLSDDVRAAARRWQGVRNVSFVDNVFSW